MGTRNLTCVVKDGEYVVAKYCQWDGHLDSKGQTIVDFLVEEYDPVLFETQIDRLNLLSREDVIARWKEVGADDSGMVTLDVSRKFQEENAHLHRDMGGGELLKYIQFALNPESGELDVEFAADSLFCEYAYVLDLDTNTFEVYTGFNKEPLPEGDRFKFLEAKREEDSKYYPVKCVQTFPISLMLGKRYAEWLDELSDDDEDED